MLFYPQFSPQNAENRILGLWNFKIFWISMPLDPLPHPIRKRGLTAPCWYSQLLYSNLLATSNFYWNPCQWLPLGFLAIIFLFRFSCFFFVHHHGKTINCSELSIDPYLQECVPLPLETYDIYIVINNL